MSFLQPLWAQVLFGAQNVVGSQSPANCQVPGWSLLSVRTHDSPKDAVSAKVKERTEDITEKSVRGRMALPDA